MSDRAYYYCPTCQKNGTKNELLRGAPEVHLFRCQMGHAFTYEQLQELGAEMIPLHVEEKPAPTDIKVQLFVDPNVWQKFTAKYPNQKASTINSILALMLDDDLVMVSGEQARKLKKLGIRNGADMIAAAEENKRLEGENADLVKDNQRFYSAIAGSMAGAEV